MRIRSKLTLAIHQYFNEQDFIHMHTPILTPLDCEGAGELFEVNHLDIKDFWGLNKSVYLTVSGQLYAEMCTSSISKIYTFGPTFRAENSNTSRHLSEFWMLEPEIANCNLNQLINISESLIKYLALYIKNTYLS